jgi:hypothetical protein
MAIFRTATAWRRAAALVLLLGGARAFAQGAPAPAPQQPKPEAPGTPADPPAPVESGPAEPAPPDYKPPAKSGPAEPAPPDYTPPGRTLPLGEEQGETGPTFAELPKWHLAFGPRLAVNLGQNPQNLPGIGYGGGLQVTRALVPVGRMRFGLGFDFSYDRFEQARAAGTQFLSHASFAALAVLDGIFGRVRPFLTLGGGLSVGAYENPPINITTPRESLVTVAGLVALGVGLGVRLFSVVELGLRGDFLLTFAPDTVGTPPVTVFQPGRFSATLDLGFRF